MKYIGIDFGSKRVGVAVSDQSGSLAFPKVVLANDKKLLPLILKIVEEENALGIVIGESKNYSGEPNAIMSEVEKFKKEIEDKTDVEVYFEPEFMTSAQAVQLQGKNEMLDASAATIILQSFLDKMNR